jgi:hypothetical protein
MKDRYDFSKGKRGRVVQAEPEPEGKVRITIRLDQDIVDRFLQMAEASGGVRPDIRRSSTRHYGNTWMAKRRNSRTRFDASFARN